jgi:hypothetical protein
MTKPWFAPKAWYKANITQENICNMYLHQDVMRLFFSYMVHRLSKHEHPKTVGGVRVVKNFYKNALLINAIRDPDAGFPDKDKNIITVLEKDLYQDSMRRVPLHAGLLLNDKIVSFLAYWYMAEWNQYVNKNGIADLTEPSRWSMYDGFVKKKLDPLVNPEENGKMGLGKQMRDHYKALLVLQAFFEEAAKDPEFRWNQITAEGIGDVAPAVGQPTKNFILAHWHGWRNRSNYGCIYEEPAQFMQPAMAKKTYRD